MYSIETNNFIKHTYEDMENRNYSNPYFMHLYKQFENQYLQVVFSTIHFHFMELFDEINNRNLYGNHYFRANDNRKLLYFIKKQEEVERSLNNLQLPLVFDSYYAEILKRCKPFIEMSEGSFIPEDMPEINITKEKPIFFSSEYTTI